MQKVKCEEEKKYCASMKKKKQRNLRKISKTLKGIGISVNDFLNPPFRRNGREKKFRSLRERPQLRTHFFFATKPVLFLFISLSSPLTCQIQPHCV